MISFEFLWGVLGSNQLANLLLVYISAKMVNYDHNLARIIDVLCELEDAPNIRYETVLPVKLPRFYSREV